MENLKMKAIVATAYGSPDVLKVQQVSKPKFKKNEILIRVRATSVTAADSMMRRADPFFSRLFLGLFKPKKNIPGTGYSGMVEAVGSEVSAFKAGDEVFGESGVNFGANAEYVCVSKDSVICLKPKKISFQEAAPICDGLLTSWNFLRKVSTVQAGQRVLIIGASGGLGTAGVQIARHFGAEVTGVCGPNNIELVKSLGAQHVIDYTITDFTKTGETYDIIYDAVGKSSFSKCKNSLIWNGVYISPVLKLSLLFQIIKTNKSKRKTVKFSATGLLPAPTLNNMLIELLPLIESGVLKSIVTREYNLEEAIDAHRLIDTGHKVGNVILNLC